jgi:hypothetical protein
VEREGNIKRRGKKIEGENEDKKEGLREKNYV